MYIYILPILLFYYILPYTPYTCAVYMSAYTSYNKRKGKEIGYIYFIYIIYMYMYIDVHLLYVRAQTRIR